MTQNGFGESLRAGFESGIYWLRDPGQAGGSLGASDSPINLSSGNNIVISAWCEPCRVVLELETFSGRWGGAGSGRVAGQVRRFTCRLLRVPSPALSCNENDAEHLDRDQPYPSSQKTKRMRTSFKHHQLRTMKSYFAINHNPDAKDLKQLAQKTGLTKRVLQVSWAVAGAEGGDMWRGTSQRCVPWPWKDLPPPPPPRCVHFPLSSALPPSLQSLAGFQGCGFFSLSTSFSIFV